MKVVEKDFPLDFFFSFLIGKFSSRFSHDHFYHNPRERWKIIFLIHKLKGKFAFLTNDGIKYLKLGLITAKKSFPYQIFLIGFSSKNFSDLHKNHENYWKWMGKMEKFKFSQKKGKIKFHCCMKNEFNFPMFLVLRTIVQSCVLHSKFNLNRQSPVTPKAIIFYIGKLWKFIFISNASDEKFSIFRRLIRSAFHLLCAIFISLLMDWILIKKYILIVQLFVCFRIHIAIFFVQYFQIFFLRGGIGNLNNLWHKN